MKRGEVWQVSLDPRTGSEQRGVRPALIVSSDAFNLSPGWKSFMIIPLTTSSKQAARGPSSVFLSAGTGGLSQDSYALCHQVTTLDRSKFMTRLGVLTTDDVQAIELGLLVAFDMLDALRGRI